jgi:hypothetical protein
MSELEQEMLRRLNILTKWRQPFAAWQLGTRGIDDPECKAVKDHREVTMLMRVELNALLKLLLDKKVFTLEEFQNQIIEEADHLSVEYEKKFPGLRATEHGISYDIPQASETIGKLLEPRPSNEDLDKAVGVAGPSELARKTAERIFESGEFHPRSRDQYIAEASIIINEAIASVLEQAAQLADHWADTGGHVGTVGEHIRALSPSEGK